MNKAFCRKKQTVSFLLAGCLILFNILMFTACGLDTFYEIEAPANGVEHEPNLDSIDESNNYFKFTAVSNAYTYFDKNGYDTTPPITFLGTEIYYKIYDSPSKLNSEYSSIMQSQNNASSSSQAAERIITNSFQELRTDSTSSNSVLIKEEKDGSGEYIKKHEVYIRLVDDLPYEHAQITINGSDKGAPVRKIYKNPSFDFFSLSDDLKPKSGDADCSISATDPEVYYVSMFAVSIARDANYQRFFSNVLYLGSVRIAK